MQFNKLYNPRTATPFSGSGNYVEYEPCAALKPYIKCFWGTPKPYKQMKTNQKAKEIITPDTCMDIIFDIDYTHNNIIGSFYGINDQSFVAYNQNDEGNTVSTFAIRFYAWSTILFAEDSMRGAKNILVDAACYFSALKKELEPLLFDVMCIEDRIARVQEYLLRHIHLERSNANVMNAVEKMLIKSGNVEIDQLSKDIHLSRRQLERLFKDQIGMSPKKLALLIRYQYLWNAILFNPHFNVMDAVLQYGYTDQAHLLHEFKRFHTMSITEAKKYAYKDVAFLQDKS